jgi:hypothetical protein
MLGPLLAVLLGLFASATARADEAVERAKRRELERARAEIGAELQLAAYDLVDELVLGWVEQPLFDKPTPVVLTELTVPVGLGTGLQSLVETHLTDVLLQNPETKLQLVHCPRCTSTVVHSGPEGTVVRRGHDDPALLAELGQNGNRHALFVDIEAEGSWLVLRARLTRLEPDLPVAWARTIATSSSTPALLREPRSLKSAAEARREYEDTLEGRGPITIPVRFTIRSYARPAGQSIAAPPFLWIQSGAELATTEARAWVSSFVVGYSVVPQAYQGILGQVRVNRLVTGWARSLTRPDLYAYVGGALVSVWGPSTAAFRLRQLTADELLGDANLADPRAIFATVQTGLDLRLGDRMGIGAFVETMPSLRNSPNFGDYVFFLGLPWQTLGSEVSVCF